MSDKTTDPMDEGSPIATYSRAEAIADGVLVAVPEEAQRQAGLGWPTALSEMVHTRCVTWNGDQEVEASRLRALLRSANSAVRSAMGQGRTYPHVAFTFVFEEVDSPGTGRETQLVAVRGIGDDRERVMTVVFLRED
ncbi:DUF6573 family protein [Kitasatospora sp. NPDC002965]|uniref:DUF6573 family protein n=1 Tax=Kitasatospora sp. NPDC002965 TaxID=3154775 RepID=UPI00339FADD5